MRLSVATVCLVQCCFTLALASGNAQLASRNIPSLVLNEDYIIPKVLRDKKTGVTFYLDSDGRHVTAVSAEGKPLWHVDPFVDAKLAPYRVPRPIIIYFELAGLHGAQPPRSFGAAKKYLWIEFNSSQFGILDKSTGAFVFLGQD